MKKIIIIGSGIGGLLSANLLAKKGYTVILYESHCTTGGYTAGFWRNGFYFESGTLSLEGRPSFFNILKKLDLFDKITFVKQRIRLLSKDFDGTPSSYEEFKQLFINAFPLEKEQWISFFSEIDKMYFAFSRKNLWSKFLGLFYFLKYKKVSIEKYSEKFFEKDSNFYSLVKNFAFGYSGTPMCMAAMALICKFKDYWTVKDGMQSLADILTKNLQKLGGKVHLNSLVEKIITKNGIAQGISYKNNLEKADVVIAACDYKQVFLKLLDDPSKIDTKKITKSEVSESIFTIYLGLKLSNDELRKHLKTPYVDFYEKNMNDDYSFSLYSPSLINDKLAPQGKSSLMILIGLASEQKESFRDKKMYKERKNQMKEIYIKKASLIIPNLNEYIEIEDAATPFTYERFTHNTDGATSGWSWDLNKSFNSGFDCKVKTPIKNLYIGSCWASAFGGIPGAVSAAISCVDKIP